MTQWRTQTATFVQDNPIDASADFFQSGLFIGKDGTKLYHIDANDKVYEYDMSAYDISTMSLLQSFDVSAQETSPRSVWFTPDGLTMFVLGAFRVYEYNLSTAWNVTTAVFGQQKTILQDNSHQSIFFRADGLLMFTIGTGTSTEGSADRVYKYELSTPYDISTITFNTITGSFHVSENLPTGIFFEDNGLRMFVLGATDTFLTTASTMWEYPLSIAFDILTTSPPSELDLEAEDTTPFGVYFQQTPQKNAGARFWHGGREFDKIYEWTMEQIGVDEGFTVNAILTLEFVEIEVGAKVVNRFDTGGALQVGARLVLFCDYIDTNVGWIQTDPNNQIFVDEGGFPDRIHFERVPAGGGAVRRWVAKNTGKTVSGDVKFEFKFDLLDDNPTLNFSGGCAVLLADSFNHEREATDSGRSYIGFRLARVRSEGRHIFFGVLSDGTTTVTTIEGGTENQHTHEVYKQTSGGADIQKGPYYCTIELKDNLLRTSIYLDSARTQHMRGSPREADATGINPTNLQHLIVSNPLGGGSAREITADFDELCFTQNEPLQIIPEKPFPAVGQFTEGWETYGLGDQNPTPWTSLTTLGGAPRTVLIDIRQVSDESPEEGTQEFKQHLKYISDVGGSTTGSSRVQRTVGPAIVNTDGSGIDLARFLTARQKADIINGAFNGEQSGITVSFSPLSGGPSIGQMQFGLFGQGGNLFGSNSIRLNLDSPVGTYAGIERFDLKLLLNTDSFLSNNQGVDWENHVKSITIRIGTQTFSTGTVGSTPESLIHNDYVALWGTKLDIFLVDALLKTDNLEEEFDVGAILVLVDQVQLIPKVSAVLKKLDQEKEFFIGAEIGAFETEVFFSSTHFQDITPLVSGVGVENKEFIVTGKVVIRTAVNSAIISAFIKALGQEKEFTINGRLLDTVGITTIISAFLTGGQDIFLIMNAILKALNQEQEFIVDALIGDINIVESTVDAFIQQQGIITIPPQFRVDALLQAQGVIIPPSQPTVDAILVITIVPNDVEFTINAILGLGEFESILDVESVIGSKTGSQTVI